MVAASRRTNRNPGFLRTDPARDTHSMSTAPPEIRDFARRLVALEAARDEPPVTGGSPAVRVCEKLRLPLARLAGTEGFRALLSRAVALAKSEVHSLGAVVVRADGSLEGLDGAGHDQDAGAGGEGGVAVVARLLDLLATFIGEPLTLRLVRDAWPEVSAAGADVSSEGER